VPTSHRRLSSERNRMVNMDTDDVSLDDNEMGEYHEMIKELGTFPVCFPFSSTL